MTPAAGQPTPSTIRGRFGMPDHGHWVTEEEAHDAQSPAPLAFTGEFPMHGRYRFRIWIDYPDGRTVKTAIDLWLEPERAIEPVVVLEVVRPHRGKAGSLRARQADVQRWRGWWRG